jgi:hypothetical protein
MLKTGFSREQLSQLARERGLSSASLSNMIERKNSFDALMSLDFQSLQSIDNLANLIQTGGGASGNVPSSGMKNWSAGGGAAAAANESSSGVGRTGSSGSLNHAARRLASTGQMESFLRSLSSNNMRNSARQHQQQDNDDSGAGQSNANLQSLLQNMQSGSSMSSLLGAGGNAASAASLAHLLRDNSSTGLTALRMQDGLNQRNSSVEDFLSLVAAGDIPHQDPSLLNVPLMQHQRNNNQTNNHNNYGNHNDNDHAGMMLAQQQLLAQATGNPALANALASRSLSNLRNASGSLSNLRNAASGSNLASSGSAAEFFARSG